MESIGRLPHFGKKGEKPKMLDLNLFPARINEKGYPAEGNLLISIDDGEKRLSFQLTPQEGAYLIQRIQFGLSVLAEQFMKVSAERAKQSQLKTVS